VEKVSPEKAPSEKGLSREELFAHGKLANCALCGALVPPDQMEEHLLGDEVILRIIRHNNPGWSPKECLDYYVQTYRPGTTSKS
jgi:hypothetical protein